MTQYGERMKGKEGSGGREYTILLSVLLKKNTRNCDTILSNSLKNKYSLPL